MGQVHSLIKILSLLLILAGARVAHATNLAPEFPKTQTTSSQPCQHPFDIDDYTPLPSSVTTVPTLQAKVTAAPAAGTASKQTSAQSGGSSKQGSSSGSAGSPEDEFVQLAASMLVYNAETETGTWAVDRFYKDFCIGDADTVGKFPFTCTQAERYEVISPSRPDIAGLQRALRADIKVFLACSVTASSDEQAAWLTLTMGLDEILRGSFTATNLSLISAPTMVTAASAAKGASTDSADAGKDPLTNVIGKLADAMQKQGDQSGNTKQGAGLKSAPIDLKLQQLMQSLHRVPGLIQACKDSANDATKQKEGSFACAMYFGSLAYDADLAQQAAGPIEEGHKANLANIDAQVAAGQKSGKTVDGGPLKAAENTQFLKLIQPVCGKGVLRKQHGLYNDPGADKIGGCSRKTLVLTTIKHDGFDALHIFDDADKHIPDDDSKSYIDGDSATSAYLSAAQRAYLSGNFMAESMGKALIVTLANFRIVSSATFPNDIDPPAGCTPYCDYPYVIPAPTDDKFNDLDRLVRLHNLLQAASGGDYYDALKILAASECSAKGVNISVGGDGDVDTTKQTCRLLYVATDITTATNTDDMETAVEQLGSTTAGWRYKEVSDGPFGLFTISGILGLDYEREILSGQGVSRTNSVTGIFAPVGIEMTHPSWWDNTYWGLLLSVIDLGNAVQYGSQQTVTNSNNSTGQVSTASGLKQVWAPGLHLFMSIPSSPFVVGFGYSRTPAFRTAQFGNGTNVPLDSRRVMFFIGVDTELFPL